MNRVRTTFAVIALGIGLAGFAPGSVLAYGPRECDIEGSCAPSNPPEVKRPAGGDDPSGVHAPAPAEPAESAGPAVPAAQQQGAVSSEPAAAPASDADPQPQADKPDRTVAEKADRPATVASAQQKQEAFVNPATIAAGLGGALLAVLLLLWFQRRWSVAK